MNPVRLTAALNAGQALRPGLVACWLTLSAVAAAPLAAQDAGSGGSDYRNLIFEVSLPATMPAGSAPGTGGEGAAGASVADTDSPRKNVQTLVSLQDAIDSALASDGLYSPLLRERYQQLGALQQQLGQHETAVATFEQAVHIARVNDGLFTLDQLVDIERIIANLEAAGDAEREADYRAYLYFLQQRAYAPADPRLIAAKTAWADWNLRQYQKSALLDPSSVRLPGGENPQELVVVRDTRSSEVRFVPRRNLMGGPLLNDALADPTRYSLQPEMIVDTRLREARDLYRELLDESGDALGPEERERLHLQLATAEYTLKHHIDRLIGEHDASSPFMMSTGTAFAPPAMLRRGFRDSQELLERDVTRLEAEKPVNPMTLAAAYLRLADLNTAYDRRRDAEAWYAKVWSSLLQAGLDADAASAWLEQTPLQPVPAFALHPYSRELFGLTAGDSLPWRGYIDVSLNLTRDGDVRSANIVDATPDTPQRVRRMLLAHLRNQKMRPRLENGVPVTRDDLLLRFHYSF